VNLHRCVHPSPLLAQGSSSRPNLSRYRTTFDLHVSSSLMAMIFGYLFLSCLFPACLWTVSRRPPSVGVAIRARGLAELRTEVDTEGRGNTNGSATHARADDDDDDDSNSRSSNKHFHGSGAVRANQGTAVADGCFWLMASMMEDHRHGRERWLEVSQKTSVAKGARRSCIL